MDYTDNVGYQIKLLQSVIRQQMDKALAQDGLTTPQYATLMALSAQSTLTNAELARVCFVTAQTMHRITSGLKKAGLLVVLEDPEDGKRQYLQTTPPVAELLQRAQARVAAIERQMLKGLDASEVADFKRYVQNSLERLS